MSAELSQTQRQALDRFLEQFQGNPIDDVTALRFLNANAYSVEKSRAQYAKYIAWRNKNNVDEILEKPPAMLDVVRHIIPFEFHGHDRDGCPVFIERTGMIQCEDMVQCLSVPDVVRSHTYVMEMHMKRAAEASARIGRKLEQFLLVLDFAGLSLSHRLILEYLQELAAMDEAYYPGCVKNIIIVNPPSVLKVLWPVIRPVLSTSQTDNILVIQPSSEEKLTDYIAVDELPEEYGGRCSCDGGCVRRSNPMPIENVLLPKGADAQTQSIAAGSKHQLELMVKDGVNSRVEWYFRTINDGIGVSIEWQPQGRDSVVIHSNGNLLSSKLVEKGTEELKGNGKVVVTISNSSWFSTKQVVHFVRLIDCC